MAALAGAPPSPVPASPAARTGWIVLIGGLIAGRIALGVALFDPVWSPLTWDDFTRVALADQWAGNPFFTIPGDLVWLPGQLWVLGLAFAATGDIFAADPMRLAAIVNTVCVVAAAGLAGWTGRRLFDSPAGGMVAFVAVLASPWGWFAGQSGLSEPLWWVAVMGVIAAFVAWHRSRTTALLAAGSVAVALGATMRYDGWFLAGAWLLAIGYWSLPAPRRPGDITTLFRVHRRTLAVAAAPLLVPAGWLVVNLVQTGNPVAFVSDAAGYGTGAGGGLVGLMTYYPAPLVRSAPLLLVALAVAAAAAWPIPGGRALLGLVVAFFLLFNLTAPFSLGAFTERITFTFPLAATPLLAVSPSVLARIRRPSTRGAAVAAAAVAAVTVTAIRLADPPREWIHAPDLLTLADAMDPLALPSGDTLLVGFGAGMAAEGLPVSTIHGDRIHVVHAPSGSADAPPEGVDLWVERLPERVLETGREPDAVIGRYHAYGMPAAELDLPPPCCPGWTYVAETGEGRAVRPSPYLGLEFLGDDPPAGAEARLVASVARSETERQASLRLRCLYGHGVNEGRIVAVVRVDGREVFRTDIAARTRWRDVTFTIPPGPGSSTLEIAVVALPGIETGWAWGRSSTVLVEEVAVQGQGR